MKACCRGYCLRPSAFRLQSYLLLSPSENAFQPGAFLSVSDHSILLFFLAFAMSHTIITFFAVVKRERTNFTDIYFPLCQKKEGLPPGKDLPLFYSTDFSDSTISIFFSFQCINRFTTAEKIQVITAQYKKLTGRIFLPNITASTSTVTII